MPDDRHQRSKKNYRDPKQKTRGDFLQTSHLAFLTNTAQLPDCAEAFYKIINFEEFSALPSVTLSIE
jgi:hypothetical protein